MLYNWSSLFKLEENNWSKCNKNSNIYKIDKNWPIFMNMSLWYLLRVLIAWKSIWGIYFTNSFNDFKLLFGQQTAWLLSVGVNSSYFVEIIVNVYFTVKESFFLYLIKILFELWLAGTNTGMVTVAVYTS